MSWRTMMDWRYSMKGIFKEIERAQNVRPLNDPLRWTADTNIYEIEAPSHIPNSRAIKVGVSKDPLARLPDLQTGSPGQLLLLKTHGPFSRTYAYWAESLIRKAFFDWPGLTSYRGEWYFIPTARMVEADEIIKEVIDEVEIVWDEYRLMKEASHGE